MVLIVKVAGSVPTISVNAFRQQRYKKLSVELSCRKYLDALAGRLGCFYSFPWAYNKPTIGDLLKAKDGVFEEDWDFIKATKKHTTIDSEGFSKTIGKGQPLVDIELPELYSPEEWKKISKFNFATTQLVHDAAIPRDSKGNMHIIIPHSEFTTEMAEFLQTIGVRAQLFSKPEDLQIKDESMYSEGESSASNSPKKLFLLSFPLSSSPLHRSFLTFLSLLCFPAHLRFLHIPVKLQGLHRHPKNSRN